MRTLAHSNFSSDSGLQTDAGAMEGAVRPLLHDLHAQQKDIQVFAARQLAALARTGAAVSERLLQLLAGPHQRARWGAAYTLSLLDGTLDLRCLPAILEALHTGDGDVRWAAAGLMARLAKLYPVEVQNSLLELLGEQDANARKMALYCLRELDAAPSALITPLRAACAALDSQVRIAALALLKHLLANGKAQAQQAALADIALQVFQHDPNAGVRRAAAHVLASISHPPASVQDTLARAAEASEDPALRKIALRAIERKS